MKTQKKSNLKKLDLNKETLVILNKNQQAYFLGGVGSSMGTTRERTTLGLTGIPILGR
jgi:hypothetical protein